MSIGCSGRKNPRPILPGLHVIQLQDTLTPAEFLLSVLSNVLNSLRTVSKEVEKDKTFRKLALGVEQSLIQTRTFQASAAGFGVGYGSSASATNPSVVLTPTISRKLDICADLVRDMGYERIVINVNNLDIIPPASFASFLDQVRDLTIIRRPYLWVFVGPVGSRSVVGHYSRRVSELVTTDPIVLPPLSKAEVHLAIAERIRKYSLKPGTASPVSQEVIDTLYDASQGEVRYILNRATDLLMKTMLDFPTTSLVTREVAMPMLVEMTQSVVARTHLTKRQLEVLSRIAARGAVQPKDFSAHGFKSPQALVRYLSTFYQMTLLDKRKGGRDVVYVPRGDVAIALRPALPGQVGRA